MEYVIARHEAISFTSPPALSKREGATEELMGNNNVLTKQHTVMPNERGMSVSGGIPNLRSIKQTDSTAYINSIGKQVRTCRSE